MLSFLAIAVVLVSLHRKRTLTKTELSNIVIPILVETREGSREQHSTFSKISAVFSENDKSRSALKNY